MRVLHINTTSHRGGAARAMQRLHQALVESGHESQFLAGRTKHPEDPLVHLIWDEVAGYNTLGNRVRSRIGNQLEKYIGIHPWANLTNRRFTDTDLYAWADIIDLRNLFGGYFNMWCLPELTVSKPVVWRMPDLWAVTGHCAYPYDCQRWKTGCYSCPLLRGEGRDRVEPKPTVLDGTRRVWKAKRDLYRRSRLHVIVTTKWMREQVSRSILSGALSINVISNGVDLNAYRPHDRLEARQRLGLDPDQKILLWAAGGKGNYRKGYHLAYQALEQLQSEMDDPPTLITMAGEEGWSRPETLRKVRHFGYVREEEQQGWIYAAADAFLCTTLADAQPQTVLESLASGTPVIAFPVGPMPDLALEGRTGVIVPEVGGEALAAVIRSQVLELDQLSSLRESSRAFAEEHFNLGRQTEQYITLYEDILRESSKAGK
ncbi:MAG: glycosyltransferase [Anaerolineales bacterium]